MIARRTVLALAALLALVALPIAAPGAEAATRQATPAMELAAQTPLAEPDSEFVARLRLTGVPDDGSIALAIRGRVRSRSELAASIEGEASRTTVFGTTVPVTSVPLQADGTRRLVISLDTATTEGIRVRLPAAGVYPLELTARDAADNELASLVTHMIAPPPADDTSPRLHVAPLAELGAPPALQPDGTTVIDRAALGDAAGLVAALQATPDVPASIVATPETLDALAVGTEPGDLDIVDGLRQAAVGRAVLERPYVDIALDSVLEAGLSGELLQQVLRGEQVLSDALGEPTTATTWPAEPDLGARGLDALPGLGVQHVIVGPEQVEPLPEGLLDLSLAHRFSLAPPTGTAPSSTNVDAIALDPGVLERLATDGTSALVASRVLTELAVLWFEQPGIPRGVVLPLGPSVDPTAIRAILEGLGAGGVYAPVTVDELFGATSPLVDAGDNPVVRALTPESGPAISDDEVAGVRAAREALGSFNGLVGPDSPRTDPLARQLLLGTASELARATRQAHVEAVDNAIDDVTETVTGPERFTLTLTARTGTIPLTLRNGSGIPLNVLIHLESPKLDFPEGTDIQVTLEDESTRLDIPVEARASGAFPLDIEVTTPDGRRELLMSRYTIRSTAVAGAGVLLSVGAGLFLVVWWARHWRRTRRSARLVATAGHPAHVRRGT